jgi:hypothetical protein
MSNSRIWPCTNDEYHADTTAISHSGLDLVIRDPALYWWEKLSGKAVREEKEHFAVGSAFDNAILRPSASCGSDVIVIPETVLAKNGARAGSAWKEFAAANEGRILVKEGDEMLNMVRAVQSHQAARELIEAQGEFQQTIVWRDDEHRVLRRARFDMLHLGAELIVDLKTTRTPATLVDCAYEAEKWGYHRQAAFYCDAVSEHFGTSPSFVFIFCSKIPPYRVEVFELDPEDIEIGREENDAGLATYAECLRTGNWLPATHGRITRLSLPRRSRWNKQWSV